MNKINVLIAEDIEIIAELMKKILETKENINIIGIANDGKDEIQKISDLKPDIVVTDNNMPFIDGIDVIDMVYNSNMEYKPKFILVTGNNDFKIRNRAIDLGVVDVIYKPICDWGKLFESINYAINSI